MSEYAGGSFEPPDPELIAESVAFPEDWFTDGWFRCCPHCGCVGAKAVGHDDTCTHGCNDEELRLNDGDAS